MALEDGLFSDYYKSMAELGFSRVEAANKLASQYDIAPIEVYQEPEVVDLYQEPVLEATVINQSPTSVTQPITQVDETGILEGLGETGGLLDRGLQYAIPVFGAARELKAFFEPDARPGTVVGGIHDFYTDPESWWGGLFGTPTGQGLFGQDGGAAGSDSPWDEGSYTTSGGTGDYSYGTIDNIGVEDPY